MSHREHPSNVLCARLCDVLEANAVMTDAGRSAAHDQTSVRESMQIPVPDDLLGAQEDNVGRGNSHAEQDSEEEEIICDDHSTTVDVNEAWWNFLNSCCRGHPLAEREIQKLFDLVHSSSLPVSKMTMKTLADYRRTRGQVLAKAMHMPVVRVTVGPRRDTEFFFIRAMEAVKRLVQDKLNAPGFMWGPEAVYNDDGDRVFKEAWTADWWHIAQVCETHSAGKVTRDTDKEPWCQNSEVNNITITTCKTH